MSAVFAPGKNRVRLPEPPAKAGQDLIKLAPAMGLREAQRIALAQTVGFPA